MSPQSSRYSVMRIISLTYTTSTLERPENIHESVKAGMSLRLPLRLKVDTDFIEGSAYSMYHR